MPTPLPPTGLLTDLLRDGSAGVGTRPRFSWIVCAGAEGFSQTAWQIAIHGVWDSGRIGGADSTSIPYAGPDLPAGRILQWRVRVWGEGPDPGPWSAPAGFRIDPEAFARPEPPRLHREQAARIGKLDDGCWLADFARAAFAAPVLRLDGGDEGRSIAVHVGERCLDGRIDRKPPGTIRHRTMTVAIPPGVNEIAVAVPPDQRNTTPPGVLVPAGMPEVIPFRYLEIEGLPTEPALIARDVLRVPCDRSASRFQSDDPALDAVWELCAHSVDATTFLGVYVDGDRERIAYEGDAWINQLSHRALDRTPATARATIDHLLRHPTWPTEWQLHMPLMAWEDWLWSGDRSGLERWRDDLALRTLAELDRGDGLITTYGTVKTDLLHRLRLKELHDLVDWPPGAFTASGGTGERDGHEMPPVNTVVNAFHAEACRCLALIDAALGRDAEAAAWRARAERTAAAINAQLWDEATGAYVDGIGSRHCAQHSSLFPLAFGLVPPDRTDRALGHVIARGMACSVYAAQHLLDGLFRHDRADSAIALMTARHDRSWLRMLEVGSTITLEAWDWRYKNNLDWNHAWATAPLNVCARWILGVQPIAPGCAWLAIHPQPGRLRRIAGRVPTMRGPVEISVEQEPGQRCELTCELPGNVSAELSVPWSGGVAQIRLDGRPTTAHPIGGRIRIGTLGPGLHHLQVIPVAPTSVGTAGGLQSAVS